MRLRTTGAASLLAAAAPFAGCTSSAPKTASAPAAAPVSGKPWGYTAKPGVAGPSEWGSLPGSAACSTGKRQSPLDLGTKPPAPTEAKDLPNLVFHYRTTALHLVNDGHTIQADVAQGSTVEIDGVTWRLLQFHFHAPSEHSLDGFHYPMEIHFVHAGKDGRPGLVVAAFVVQGGATPAFGPVFANLPKEKGGRRDDPTVILDLAKLLPADRTYLTYDGSLTTPPCAEGVRWYVLRSPVGVAGEELSAFGSIPGMMPTNRPVQLLEGRRILLDSTP
jgi:carbonic anhydrase